MPPIGRWRTLSRVATSPFRKSGDSPGKGGKRDGSNGPPSRKGSLDLPRSESPAPAEELQQPTVGSVAKDAPAVATPPASNPMPISVPDEGAVDLSSLLEPDFKDQLPPAVQGQMENEAPAASTAEEVTAAKDVTSEVAPAETAGEAAPMAEGSSEPNTVPTEAAEAVSEATKDVPAAPEVIVPNGEVRVVNDELGRPQVVSSEPAKGEPPKDYPFPYESMANEAK